MNSGVFIFMVLAIIAVGLLVFSYTKAGKRAFYLDEPNDEN
jgi:hypothetical protein